MDPHLQRTLLRRRWSWRDLPFKPDVLYLPDSFSWSGSSFGSGVNLGSQGGAFGGPGGVTKSAPINGRSGAVFNETAHHTLANITLAGDEFNLVVGSFQQPVSRTGACVGHGWSSPSASTWYPRINNTGSTGSLSWSNGDSLSFNDRLNAGFTVPAPITDSGVHILSRRCGTVNRQRVDGADSSLSGQMTSARASFTSTYYIGDSNGGEGMLGTLYLVLVSQKIPSDDDWLRLEGAASWEFRNSGVSLAASHRYKNGPPMCVLVDGVWVPEEAVAVRRPSGQRWRRAA